MKLIVKLFICSSLLMATSSFASEQALQRFFSQVSQFQADFSQKVSDDLGNVLEQTNGKFYLSRPGKFRWDYFSDAADSGTKELSQQIIADNNSIYFYDPDLEQVTVRNSADALAQVPSLILVHSGNALDKFFSISSMATIEGISWVSLKPKSEDAGYSRLMVGFKNESLNAIILNDGLGNETRLTFSNIIENPKLNSLLFKFKAPEGTDILKDG